MVNFSGSVLYALLATAASAELRHDRRHHQHRRKAPCTTGTLVGASSTAPYAMSNSTTIVGPTGTGNIGTTTVSATSTMLSTVTVVPLPVSSGAGSSPSSSAAAGGGSPGSAPGSSPSSSAAAGAGVPGSGASGSGQCAPATVTVTAQNTVTVTAGAGGAPGSPSSSPAAASSPIAPSSVAVTSSAAAGSGSPKPLSPSSHSSCAHPVSRAHSSSAQASSSAAASAASSWSAQASSAATSAASSAAAVSTAQSSAPVQQAATSTSASSTPTSAAAAPPAGGKCGLAYTSSDQVGSSSPFNSGNTPWGYNWYYESMGLPEGVEFVPSLQKPEWTSSLVAALPQATGVKYIKSINEPDMSTGSGGTAISPGDAVQLYTGTLNALSSQYKIGAPAVTSYNTTSGLAGFASGITWLQQFHDACAGNCNIGWVDLHWYADGQNGEAGNAQKQASDFLTYVEQATADAQALYGSDIEIWITEFSAYPTADTDPQINVDFLKAVLPTLDSSAVTRYSYFMAEYLESGSSLTSVGSALFSSS
ncbi:MAG: hypothetical protein LQ340_003979 [Diploschistes diacapsis]|nr:MAG: hypothetical protein LQ340_003979 [Diploschistes diacapsis]